MSRGRALHSCNSFIQLSTGNEYVIVAGGSYRVGCDSGKCKGPFVTSSVEIYNVKTMTWTEGPMLPHGIQSGVLVHGDGKTAAAYLIGGSGSERIIPPPQDPNQSRWNFPIYRSIYMLTANLSRWIPYQKNMITPRHGIVALTVPNVYLGC